MPFLKEAEPERDVMLPVMAGISRIVAPNSSVMTYHGTNTFLIEAPEGIVVLDPGPEDLPAHVEAILAATDGRVAKILISHTHHDHLGAAPALKAATGAPIAAFHQSQEPSFTPDIPLRDGDMIAGMTAIHMPGHASDHMCFARAGGVLFTGDHVMAWSSTVVGPPHGDMTAYCDNLRRLLTRDDTVYLPAHGPALPDPHPFVRDLLASRMRREEAILRVMREGPIASTDLVQRLYGRKDPRLHRAASRIVMAHLIKLEAELRVVQEADDVWRTAPLPQRKTSH